MRPHRTHTRIYLSRMHVAVTLFFVILPFAVFLLLSRITQVPTSELLPAVMISLVRLVISYLIAAVLAWISAIAFYHGRRSVIALPIFDVLQSFPTFAALPLATLAWGRSNTTVIVFLVITVIWPIFFSIISSLKLMKHDWEEAVEMSGLRGWLYLKNFIWPVTVPGLIMGSIIGLGEGWEALVATEIIVQIKSGLGNFFQIFSTNTTATAFGIFGLLALIFSVNKLLWLPLLERTHKTMAE